MNLTLAPDNVTSTIQVTLARDNVRGGGVTFLVRFVSVLFASTPLVFVGPL